METVRFTLRIPEPLQKKLNEKAEEAGMSRNAYIIQACREFIEERDTAWKSSKEARA